MTGFELKPRFNVSVSMSGESSSHCNKWSLLVKKGSYVSKCAIFCSKASSPVGDTMSFINNDRKNTIGEAGFLPESLDEKSRL